jgi:hypothetical protein
MSGRRSQQKREPSLRNSVLQRAAPHAARVVSRQERRRVAGMPAHESCKTRAVMPDAQQEITAVRLHAVGGLCVDPQQYISVNLTSCHFLAARRTS